MTRPVFAGILILGCQFAAAQAHYQIGARLSEVTSFFESRSDVTTWYHSSSVFKDGFTNTDLAKLSYVCATANSLYNMTIMEYATDDSTAKAMKVETADRLGKPWVKGTWEGKTIGDETWIIGTKQFQRQNYHLVIRSGRRILHMNVDVRKNGNNGTATLSDQAKKFLDYFSSLVVDKLEKMPYGAPATR